MCLCVKSVAFSPLKDIVVMLSDVTGRMQKGKPTYDKIYQSSGATGFQPVNSLNKVIRREGRIIYISAM